MVFCMVLTALIFTLIFSMVSLSPPSPPNNHPLTL
jgi:hypothetical protein